MDDLRRYTFVVRQLVSREVKRKYSRSHLGILWSVLNPLLSMAIISMIFSKIFHKSIENYPIYYLTASLMWQMFTESTNSGLTALVDNKNLLIKVKLPMVIFPLSRVLTALLNMGYSCVAYMIMLLVFRIRPSVTMLVFPFILVLLLLFCIGMAYTLSSAYVFFGDIKHLYSVVLTLWMYCSAIFYPVDGIPEPMKTVILNNPVYNYISAARKCIMYRELPNLSDWIRMLGWGIGMYIIGYWVFRRTKNRIMQKI